MLNKLVCANTPVTQYHCQLIKRKARKKGNVTVNNGQTALGYPLRWIRVFILGQVCCDKLVTIHILEIVHSPWRMTRGENPITLTI